MRTRLLLLFLVILPFACASAFAQSQPNWGRDYVYGPADRLALTIERDTYAPPAPPNLTGSWTDNGDGTCTEHLAWTAPTDIGSGVVSYSVYRNAILLGSTSSRRLSTSTSRPARPELPIAPTMTRSAKRLRGKGLA